MQVGSNKAIEKPSSLLETGQTELEKVERQRTRGGRTMPVQQYDIAVARNVVEVQGLSQPVVVPTKHIKGILCE
jgi:hypothetical protein